MRAPAQIRKQSQSGAISRRAIVWLAIPVFLATALLGVWWGVQHKFERARADWKAATLPRLTELTLTNQDISRDLDTLRAGAGSGENREWISDHVLLMTNGECLIYAFRHGFNNGFVDHLFLAHGSDGRWYYSTYHFCNMMAAVMSDGAPGSIAQFARRYSVREFDGKSDECLQHTWP